MVEAVKDLAAALAKARKAFPAVVKNKTGQARGGKYKYADLSSILDAVTGPLSDNGLAVTQVPKLAEAGVMVLETRIMHCSGESIFGTFPLPVGVSSQEMGSALTYARRYALSAMLSIAADDDDDGAEAQHIQPTPPPAPAAAPKPATKASPPTWRGGVSKVEEVLPGRAWKIVGSMAEEFFTSKPEHADVARSAATAKGQVTILFHKTAKKNNECDAVDPVIKENVA
jgi:hypothetical protein